MNQKTKLRSCIKEKDGWWASKFSGPLANRLLEPICEISWLTPNQLTLTSLFIGFIACVYFFKGDHVSIVLGGILVQLSFIVDCMDGQFARYSKKFSAMGAWLDRISDRIKDFAYFFSLAFGFFKMHPDHFQYGITPLVNFISNFMSHEQYFSIDPLIHVFTMQSLEIASWTVFPVAMIAMFTVFLIDYYVNQDMKFPVRNPEEQSDEDSTVSLRTDSRGGEKTEIDNASSSTSVRREAPSDLKLALKKSNAFLAIIKPILKFGLQVYKAIPILRFNIGEQALLITIFCLLNSVFSLLCFFAALGSFYVFYWPFAKYFGFTELK